MWFFLSAEFLMLFLPIVLILYNLCNNIRYKNFILLASSLLFYAWGEPVFVFLMLFSVFINWILGLQIGKYEDKKHRKRYLVIGVIWNILIIFVYKYLSFTCDIISSIFKITLDVNIVLPIKLSFFTFQIMSYLFDVYYRKAQVQKNVFNLALYISMFPQLIAGPIVRYETVDAEIMNRKVNSKEFTAGVIRFVYGLSKKVIVSNYVDLVADNIFSVNNSQMSVMTAWLGAIAYTLQIYFDFSGYSDMAIGLGLMFGFHFEENFNYPYAAKSVTDFWRRWHISLSTWFRDYVYIPLGGNRVGPKRHILNMFAVWMFTGIWHGANFTFILWGLVYFVLLCIEKYTGIAKKAGWFSRIYTLLAVVLLWVVFRAESISDAFSYIAVMFGNGYCFADKFFLFYLDSSKWVLVIGAVFALPVVRIVNKFISSKLYSEDTQGNVAVKSKAGVAVYNTVKYVTVLGLFVLCLILTVNSTYNPFIYFNF